MKKIAFLLLVFYFISCSRSPLSGILGEQQGGNSPRSLPIPPIVEPKLEEGRKVIYLEAKESVHTFSPQLTSHSMGYNPMDYLGPTIRLSRGDEVTVKVKNSLSKPTAFHWHGGHVPAEADGNVNHPIYPGETWEAQYQIDQPAATTWYHPHFKETTAYQAYMGLAGFYIVDDSESDKLPLPKTYGVDDIPLVIQDRLFNEKGELIYPLSMHTVTHGIVGNVFITNGIMLPDFKVESQLVRFRLLNGSNSSIYRFSLSTEDSFTLIATDGGLLEAPVTTETLTLISGERAEIVVDFSKFKQGDRVMLLTEEFSSRTLVSVLNIEVGSVKDRGTSIPDRLATLLPVSEKIDNTRNFVMETVAASGRMGRMMSPRGRLTINGSKFDMSRVDVKVPFNTTEMWIIENRVGRMMTTPHSFHLHGYFFRVVDINGEPPPPHLAGWKDTVLLWPGDRVSFVTDFVDVSGLYMYHCHMLEHEEDGMMGFFEVK